MTLHLPDGRTLETGPGCPPLVMGILNVTPDSFSDGGEHATEDEAVAHGLAMLEQGADIIDIGGESSRPGSQRVPPGEQISRTVTVIRRLCAGPSPPIVSIDTTRSAVAAAALDAGAAIVNDISAGREDPGMFELAAARGAPLVLMHMRGTPATMQDDPRYDDVVAEVATFLLDRAAAAAAAGVARGQIVIDPGIGFGKTLEHNLALMANLPRFVKTGYPVLLGASRKRFLRQICHVEASATTPQPNQSELRALVWATCATTAVGVAAGVAIIRVHDVAPNRQAADVAWRIHR